METRKDIYCYPKYYEVGFCRPRVGHEIAAVIDCYFRHCACLPTALLDNACGTGLHLRAAAQLGLRVTGYDASPDMAEYAAARLAHLECKAHVFQADLNGFEVRRKSNVAICMNGSFQHLLTIEDVVGHLRCVARALTKKGLYLVSLPAPQSFVASPPGHIKSQWSARRGHIKMEVNWTYRQSSIDWETQTFTGMALIKVDDAGKRCTLRMPYTYRVFFPQEIRSLAILSGCFEVVEIYGDMQLIQRYAAMRKPKNMNVLLARQTRN